MTDPNKALEHYNRGVELVQQDRDEDAIREFRAALQQDPQCWDAHHGLATIYLAQRRFAQALGEYKAAVRIAPENASLYVELGTTYLALNRVSDAISELKHALSLDPDNFDAHFLLGTAYAAKNRNHVGKEATLEFEEAVRIEPKNARALLPLAKGYVAQGCEEEGYRLGKTAAELGDPLAREWLLKGADSLIDRLVDLSTKLRFQDAVHPIYEEFVPRYLFALDAWFFDRFVERIRGAASAREGSRLSNLMGLVLGGLGAVCGQPFEELVRMTDRRDLSEKDVEAFLKATEGRYHLAVYPVAIYHFSRLYQQWKALHTPNQDWEGPLLQMVVRVALRLRPEAQKVAELMVTMQPE